MIRPGRKTRDETAPVPTASDARGSYQAASDLDAFLRARLGDYDRRQRERSPDAAAAWQAAGDALVAAVSGAVGVPTEEFGAFVRGQLARRDQVRQARIFDTAVYELADSGFVAAVMAAAAWSLAPAPESRTGAVM